MSFTGFLPRRFISIFVITLLSVSGLVFALWITGVGSQSFLNRAYAQASGVSSWRSTTVQERILALPGGGERTMTHVTVMTVANPARYRIALTGHSTQTWMGQSTTWGHPATEIVVVDSGAYQRDGDGLWSFVPFPEGTNSEAPFSYQGIGTLLQGLQDPVELEREQLRGRSERVFHGTIDSAHAAEHIFVTNQEDSESEVSARTLEQKEAFVKGSHIERKVWIDEETLILLRVEDSTVFTGSEFLFPYTETTTVDLEDINAEIHIEAPAS